MSDSINEVAVKKDAGHTGSEKLAAEANTGRVAPTVNKNAIQSDIDVAFDIYKKLPADIELKSNDLGKLVEAMSGTKLPAEASAALNGAHDVAKHGDHIHVGRDNDATISLNQSLLGNALVLKDLKIGSVDFSLKDGGASRDFGNLSGVSATLGSEFGLTKSVDIKDVSLTRDAAGNPVITASVEDPFPKMLQTSLGLPATIPFAITIGPDGKANVSMTTAAANDTKAQSVGVLAAAIARAKVGGVMAARAALGRAFDDAGHEGTEPGALKIAAWVIAPGPTLALECAKHPAEALKAAKIGMEIAAPLPAAALKYTVDHPAQVKEFAKDVLLYGNPITGPIMGAHALYQWATGK